MIINVQPSNNIFNELGNNIYDYKDLLSELIDNSIAARVSNELLSVKIDVEVDRNMTPMKFVISDDASGIAEGNLGSQ